MVESDRPDLKRSFAEHDRARLVVLFIRDSYGAHCIRNRQIQRSHVAELVELTKEPQASESLWMCLDCHHTAMRPDHFREPVRFRPNSGPDLDHCVSGARCIGASPGIDRDLIEPSERVAGIERTIYDPTTAALVDPEPLSVEDPGDRQMP